MHEALKSTIIGFQAIVVLIGITGNVFVMFSLLRKRRWENGGNILFANLAFADIVASVSLTFVAIFRNQLFLFAAGVDIWFNLLHFFHLAVTISSETLLIIAIHRYRLLVQPLKPKFTLPMVTSFLVLIWVVGIFQYVLAVLMTYYDSEVSSLYQLIMVLVGSTVQCFLPLVIMAVLYGMMALQLTRRKFVGDTSARVQQRERENRNVVKLLVLIVCVFATCAAPHQIIMIKDAVDDFMNVITFDPKENTLMEVALSLLGVNSFVHVFIYAWKHESCRNDLKMFYKYFNCKRKGAESRSSSTTYEVIPTTQQNT